MKQKKTEALLYSTVGVLVMLVIVVAINIMPASSRRAST
jgi:hypothetical protein